MNSESLSITRTLRRLHEEDLKLFKNVTDGHTRLLDRALLPLSRAADKSILWILVGAGLAAGGGRFGRRAALRGLVSVSATSLLVNQPLKRIARRRRPALLPKARRLVRRPVSYSFPSGHAASAAAFSTAVSMEVPRMALPVGAAALGVAYSRVYSGVHYPSDVAAGAAMGAAVALATRRFWPLASRSPAGAQQVFNPETIQPCPGGKGITIVANPSSGSGVGASPIEELREALPEARIIEMDEGGDLGKALEEACRDCVALGIAGGDGSVNAAAAVALKYDKPLVVIPAGTLNHLARDLGISSVEDAARAVGRGSAVAIDVGLIAGKPFLNTASFGSYAELVESREKLEPRIGKWPAMLIALFKVLSSHEPVQVRIDGRIRKLWMIFVGNCCYRPNGFAPTWRDRLDDGKLDVRLVDATAPWGKTRLMLAVLTGTLAKTRIYEEFGSDGLEINCLENELLLARDGEVFDSPSSFRIEKCPLRLLIYRPDSGDE